MDFQSKVMSYANYIAQDEKISPFVIHKAIFRLIGLFLWEDGIIQNIYSVVPMLLIGMTGCLTLKAYLSQPIHSAADFNEFIFANVVVLVFFSSLYKLVLFHWSAAFFHQTIGYLESQPQPLDNSQRDSAFKMFMVYAGMLFNVGSSFYGMGLVNGKLPYKTDWPFNVDSTIGFSIGLLIDLLVAIYCFFIQWCMDTLLPMTLTIVSEQARRLKDTLRQVGADWTADHTLIKRAVRQHLEILRSAKLINACYRIVVMSQILYTVFHACVSIFYISKVDDIGYFISFLIVVVSAYSQLYLYCWSGQKLTDEFQTIRASIYLNKWRRSSTRDRRDLMMICHMASQEVSLSNFRIFKANHTTYLRCFQESVSYFIVLNTLASTFKS